jgi:ATP-dependent Clp protease ATP-binding subunit ClpA
MTSNIGTEHVKQQGIGLVRTDSAENQDATKARVNEAMKGFFRPEFLNRIDEVIVFHPLSEGELIHIIDIIVADVQKRLAEQHVTLTIDSTAKAWLVREGYNPAYGARPLRRTIQRFVETPLARELMKNTYSEGDQIVAEMNDENNGLRFSKVETLLVEVPEPTAQA